MGKLGVIGADRLARKYPGNGLGRPEQADRWGCRDRHKDLQDTQGRRGAIHPVREDRQRWQLPGARLASWKLLVLRAGSGRWVFERMSLEHAYAEHYAVGRAEAQGGHQGG